jgi:hypothetical protein
MKIKLNDCGDNWYTIVRAEHDCREWWQECESPYGGKYTQWMKSERLVPDACIEGDGDEMVEIALAIQDKRDISFKRVAVRFDVDGVHLYSPKNSNIDGIVSSEDAHEFAEKTLQLLFSQ